MKRLTIVLIAAAFFANIDLVKSQELVSAEFQLQYSTTLINFFGLPIPVDYPVDFYKITYTTTDTDGEQTIASGAMTVPATGACNSFPMMAYCHGTVLRRFDVPSFQNLEANLIVALSSGGYIGLAPDYLGLGEDEGVHPYVHAESQATATLDLISAAREFLESEEVQDNGEVFITGYSQGGHASMAALKYAQDNDLTEELGIVAGAPLSGPHNMSGSQADLILSDEPYLTPGYVIYLLISYQSVYGNLYTELSDVIQEPYATDVAPYFDGEQNSDDMGTVNAILPNNIDEFMRDSVLTAFETNPNHPLRVALADNDLFDWVPEIPLRMYYCDADEQVAFTNSTFTDSIMNANGAADVGSENVLPGASHGGCVQPALLAAYEFFEELASECTSTLSLSENEKEAIEIWPNPAKDQVQVSFSKGNGRLSVYTVEGKLVKTDLINSPNSELDISDLSDGNYVLTINHEGVRFGTLLVVEN